VIIDFHTHILPPFLKKERDLYIHKDRTLATLFSNPSARIVTAEELIAKMDSTNIDKSVVLGFGWTNLELGQRLNDYLIESASRYSNRLIPFCSISPTWGDAAIREVERCANMGARGIGELHPDTQGFNLSVDTVLDDIMDIARQKDLIILSHTSEPVGRNYPGKGMTKPEVTLRLIERYPDVQIVCAHWGGGLPFYNLMPEVSKSLGHCYFDSAASPFIYNANVFSVTTQLVGSERILFGSDYPLLNPSQIIRQIEAQPLEDREKRAILGGNAIRLLRI